MSILPYYKRLCIENYYLQIYIYYYRQNIEAHDNPLNPFGKAEIHSILRQQQILRTI